MMGFLNIGQSVLVPERSVIGIFDLDNTTWSHRTRAFLERAEKEGRVQTVGEDLPKSFLLCQEGDGPTVVYLAQLTTAALKGRAEEMRLE